MSRTQVIPGTDSQALPKTELLPGAPLALQRISSHAQLEQAYEEYCRLLEQGEPVDASAFCRRHSAIRSTLGRMLEIHHALETGTIRERRNAAWPHVGERYLSFHLLESLGEGAFSKVFLATEPELGNRRVAVKVTWRVASEAFTLGRIRHPHVISAFSLTHDDANGLSAICMPYLGSATLNTVLDRVLASSKPSRSARLLLDAAEDKVASGGATAESPPFVSPDDSYEVGVRKLFAGICDGLAALHQEKILHRDLKPSNVLLTPGGSPVLLDLNLAQDPSHLGNQCGGTYAYMSPEQMGAMREPREAYRKWHALDARSDLYSVGVMLWETLTGQHPFGPISPTTPAHELATTLDERQRKGFEPQLPPGWTISPALVAIIRRCLSLDPQGRPRSARELRDLLLTGTQKSKPHRSRQALVAAIFLAGVLVTGGAVSRWSGYTPLKLLESRPSDRKTYLSASEAAKNGDRETANRLLTEIVRRSPDEARAWIARSLVPIMLHEGSRTFPDYAAAYHDMEEARRIAATREVKAQLAFAYQSAGQTKKALEIYREFLPTGWTADNLEKTHLGKSVANNFAILLDQQGPASSNADTMAEVHRLFDCLLKQWPDDPIVLCNKGFALLNEGNKPGHAKDRARLSAESIAYFESALEKQPDLGQVHVTLANQLRAFPERAAEQFEHLKKAKELNADVNLSKSSYPHLNDDQLATISKITPTRERTTVSRLIAPFSSFPVWE
jgi:serine/threonine protein kinase